ncbi:MAG: pirin family protein [Rhodocyclaceae bacterium]|nr:pirin family protein [Rhodocyclaceae bacterium]
MILKRPAAARGHADHGWLKTWHSFSFADYHDPAEMGWGPLRVINDDIVMPESGFPKHGHRDMEIITWVLSGVLSHQDSMGYGEELRPGEAQRMSAGRGVFHSEFNASASEPVHLLQIWIEPDARSHEPRYEQKVFDPQGRAGRWQLIASPDGAEGSLPIHQDARLYVADLPADGGLSHHLDAQRRAYVHVARGALKLDGEELLTGDGAKISGESLLHFVASAATEVLLFDLPN